MKRFSLVFVILLTPAICFSAIGTLTLDATYECISVRITTTAQDYTEASLLLEYQVEGAGSWTAGHPLMKVHFDDDRFFGSIFGLVKNTSYNVRVKTVGCESSACWETAQIKTRNDVFTSGTANDWYVRTDGHDTSCDGMQNVSDGDGTCAFRTISKAESVSGPGDIIHIQAGVYYESVTINNSGTPGNYIKYVGEGDVYISGVYDDYDVIDGSDDWTYDPDTDSYKTNVGERTYYVGYLPSGSAEDEGKRLFNYRQKTYTLNDEGNAEANLEDLSFYSEGIEGGFWSADDGTLYVHLPDDSDPDTVRMHIGERQNGIYILSADHIIIDNINLLHHYKITNIFVKIEY